MKYKYSVYIFITLLISLKGIACDCPAFPPLSKSLFENQDPKKIVFLGRVTKVGECNDLATCTFHVKELFLGKAGVELKAMFDCSSDCQLNINPGEDWIIYAEYYRVDAIKLNFCTRSRKIEVMNNMESEMLAFGCTTADELSFLREKIGRKSITHDEQAKVPPHKNIQPSPTSKAILVIISIIVMIVIIYGSRKFLK